MTETIGRKQAFSKSFKKNSGKLGYKVIRYDERCWDDMISLAENYYRQSTRKNMDLKGKPFGDRLVVFLCQSWYDSEYPFEWRLEKDYN